VCVSHLRNQSSHGIVPKI